VALRSDTSSTLLGSNSIPLAAHEEKISGRAAALSENDKTLCQMWYGPSRGHQRRFLY
jgi:hypothetical protein